MVIVQAQPTTATLDRFFDAMAANQQFSGNVLIAEHGKVLFRKSYGFADFGKQLPNTPDIRFPIASISKLLTATAILQLQEKGKLNVSDAVRKLLPEFPYPEIKIRQLLSHTSGLPPYNRYFDSLRKESPQRIFYNADFLPQVAAHPVPLIYAPGDNGNYDNINYLVLALVIEKASGMSYKEYIQKMVLRPANMRHTVFLPLTDQYNLQDVGKFAYPHLYRHRYDSFAIKANSVPYIREYWTAYGFSGFGDYVSTVEDLLLFDEAWYGHKLVSDISRDSAYKPQLLNSGTANRNLFGLGWEIAADSSNGLVVYHAGAATGLSCVLLRNISRRQTVILFDNAHFTAQATGMKALSLLNNRTVPLPKKNIATAYGRILMQQGEAAAAKAFAEMEKDTATYFIDEEEINLLGYDLMGNDNPFHFPEEHHFREALIVFKLNADLFPGSWNAWDSYGEALLANGRKEEAIAMYRKSMELNPNNENGRKMLQQIEGK
ncbi:putative penicillin-binding protein [Flavihumibacter petaseus NBRC 106054]|uniref:Putative penicillin-binding protein n=2 Tax=Flavihumibacter TaxID=1004301 RepID=A0A0E9N302_9BACT|nr:putative penicillin-binding protein [Flavihumibacter petaseus NBRC 106054]